MLVGHLGAVGAFVTFLVACTAGGSVASLRSNPRPRRVAVLGATVGGLAFATLAAWLGPHQSWETTLGAGVVLVGIGAPAAWLGAALAARLERRA